MKSVLGSVATLALAFPQPKSVARGIELTAFFPSARLAAPVEISAAKAPTLKALRPGASSPTYTVTGTVYEAVPGQTDEQPFVTADNSRIKPHYGSKKRWLALSRDLLKPWGGKFEYGDQVQVSGLSPTLDGIYTLHDTMNKRHRRCLDVLVHPNEKIDLFKEGVKIQKVSF